MSEEYLVQCWYCLGEYDAGVAIWCSCDPRSPTKLCPYCLQCFCRASEDYISRFFEYAPATLVEERKSLRKVKDRLGELLVRSQVLTMEDLVVALNKQKETGKKLGEILIDSRFLTKEELELFLRIQEFHLPADFTEQDVDHSILMRLNPEFCLQKKVLPVRVFEGSSRSFLALAMSNTQDSVTTDIVGRKTEMFVVPFYCEEEVLSAFLKNYVPPGGAKILEKESSDYQSRIRRIITGAIKRHASDIHIEPDLREINVRYRIDGVLYKIKSPPKQDQGPLITGLKKLAKMDLRRSGIPQSSKMVLRQGEKRYQLNLLSFPTPHGESISIKIVDLSTFLRGIHEIGFDDSEYDQVRRSLDGDHGLILVSSPLMHGSSTTMYSMMGYHSRSGRKAMTLESPIFAVIPGIQQSEINPTVGFDFSAGLSSILRAEPEVVFLSDIPNAEVAATVFRIAAKSIVVATTTAFSAAGTISQMMEMGVSSSMLSQNLAMVINQRLIRKICEDCCEKLPISHMLLTRMGLTEEEAANFSAYVGGGCAQCNYLGFTGRQAIFEVMPIQSELNQLIAGGPSTKEMEDQAMKNGMITLRMRCLERINEGITTLEEFQKCKF